MTEDDLDREYRIDVELLKLKYAKTPAERRAAFDSMRAEINTRTPEFVTEMEVKRGLRVPDRPPIPDDWEVTVCDQCEHASCWQGEFMCIEAGCAGTKQLTIKYLRTLNLENEDWWRKDTGVIDRFAAQGRQ